MKKCSYCGKEYPDDVTVCPVDHHPLGGEGRAAAPAAAEPSASAGRVVKPATMTRLRSLHLYLGCIFAPMLLLFAITGIWQTVGIMPAKWMALLSGIHTAHKMKGGGTTLAGPLIKIFVLMMAVAFVVTTILGIMMAVKYGKNRRVAYYCLAGGVVMPVLLIVIQLMLG